MKVICPHCNGTGLANKLYESKTLAVFSADGDCPHCDGLGYVERPLTNADRIRCMTDEQLADALCTSEWCQYCDHYKNELCGAVELLGGSESLNKYCIAGCLNWLRQEAKEG